MIGYIKGKLLSHDSGTVLLENNHIGYEITCSASAYKELVNAGGGAVYTYLNVKDDALLLYGFISPQEKNMFLKLITVSGIGPKMGVTILSEMNIETLALAIASSDVKALNSVKGIGKKTAERIILELKEKVSSLDLPANSSVLGESLPQSDSDAVIALMTLGFTKVESVKAVQKAVENGAVTIEEQVSKALRHL